MCNSSSVAGSHSVCVWRTGRSQYALPGDRDALLRQPSPCFSLLFTCPVPSAFQTVAAAHSAAPCRTGEERHTHQHHGQQAQTSPQTGHNQILYHFTVVSNTSQTLFKHFQTSHMQIIHCLLLMCVKYYKSS